MKHLAESIVVLSALAVLLGALASCAPAATAVPTAALSAPPQTAPGVSPTSTQVALATSAPTPEPTDDPIVLPTPELGSSSSPEVSRISIEELKTMLDSGANVTILDVRAHESYELGHIEGAISFPWKPQMTIADIELLPRSAEIVTYCDCGPGEADGAAVALQLVELNYPGEIKVLAHPSIEGWIELGYPTE